MKIPHKKLAFCIDELRRNAAIIELLLKGRSEKEYLWKQNPTSWCLLEILCHLIDEENEDFRTRIALSLEGANANYPSIDPEGWVTERMYLKQNYKQKLETFVETRRNSIEWLETQKIADTWLLPTEHHHFDVFTAFRFLTNWVAHDYLHIKQITRLRYHYLASQTGQDIAYAGVWK